MLSGSNTRASSCVTCSFDATSIITGTADGCIVIFNVLTGRVLKGIKLFEEAVIALDSEFPYVVAVSARNWVKTFRILGDDLQFTDSCRSLYTDRPLMVKLVPSANKPCLFLAFRAGRYLDLLTISPHNTFFREFLRNGNISNNFLEGVTVNKTTLRYAGALSYDSSVCIVTGSFENLLERQSFVIRSEEANFVGAQLAWSRSCSKLYVSDSLGFIHTVQVADGNIRFRVGKVDTSRKFEDVCRELEDQAA